jgi:hypothetical protein
VAPVLRIHRPEESTLSDTPTVNSAAVNDGAVNTSTIGTSTPETKEASSIG